MDTVIQTCYRHPDQPAGIVCQRCDRPICPRCMNQASVGFHCPECTKKGAQRVYRGTAAMTTRPVLTQVLIGINLLVFALVLAQDPSEAMQGGITDVHVDFSLVAKLEVARGYFVPWGVGDGEWYRMITSGFLHYGLIHLLFNMYALWVLGSAVEHFGGRGRLAAAYSVSIVAGSLGALLITPDSFTAGASGGVFGLMGAILVAQRLQGVPFRDSPLVGVLLLNLLFTFSISNISVGGHIGGLLGGALAGWLLFAPGIQRRKEGAVIGYALCALLAVACLAAGVAFASATV